MGFINVMVWGFVFFPSFDLSKISVVQESSSDVSISDSMARVAESTEITDSFLRQPDHTDDPEHHAALLESFQTLFDRDQGNSYFSEPIPWGADGNPDPFFQEGPKIKTLCIADDTSEDTKGCRGLNEQNCNDHNFFLFPEGKKDKLDKCEWLGGELGCFPMTYSSCENNLTRKAPGEFQKIVFYSDFQKKGEKEKELANYDKINVYWDGHGPDGLGMYVLVNWLLLTPGAYEMWVTSVGCITMKDIPPFITALKASPTIKNRYSEPENKRLKKLLVTGNQMHAPWGSRATGYEFANVHKTDATLIIDKPDDNLAIASEYYTCRFRKTEGSRTCMRGDEEAKLISTCHNPVIIQDRELKEKCNKSGERFLLFRAVAN